MNQRLKRLSKLKNLAFLDGFSLKLIAMAIMFIDHIGAVFYPHSLYPEMLWLRIIGRVSFPIFAFFIAEGYLKTSNRLKYIIRMVIFAIISEVPYDLAFDGYLSLEECNVGVTFALALVGIYIADKVSLYMSEMVNEYVSEMLGFGVVLAVAFLAECIHTDYGWYGILLVYVYRSLSDQFIKKHIVATAYQLVAATWIQRYSAFSTLLLMAYNGKRGINIKYLFYIFYPAHLLLFYIIKFYMFS